MCILSTAVLQHVLWVEFPLFLFLPIVSKFFQAELGRCTNQPSTLCPGLQPVPPHIQARADDELVWVTAEHRPRDSSGSELEFCQSLHTITALGIGKKSSTKANNFPNCQTVPPEI